MAKSKKSKILAMALCASVMTGIYASPVMAAELEVELDGQGIVANEVVGVSIEKHKVTGTLTIAGADIATALTGTNLTLDSVTANTISTTGNTVVGGTLTAGATTVDSLTVNGGLTVTGGDTVIDGGRLHANKGLTVSSHGILIEEGGDLSLADGNVDVGGTLNVNGETIAGIKRDPENEVTTIEGATSFDATGMSIKYTDGFGTSLDVAGMEITSAAGLSTSFTAGGATFAGASASDITTINGGAIQTTTINGVNFSEWNEKVDNRLDVLEGKTQNIKPGVGTGTGTGEGGTAAGESNNIIGVPDTEDGTTGINGNVTVGGNITAGTGNIGGIGMEEGTITAGNGNFNGNITAGTGDIGGIDMAEGTIKTGATTINGSGMTVGTGENATSIKNDTVKAQNGDFDNLTAGSGTFGTGDNQTTINNDGVTVGDENGTSITGEGITVGDKNGVSIKNDEVRVGGGEDGKGGSYMNDTDVVTGEGVSLNQTAERVGHLENRVGELEDRIDKVGAMSAAIANLRTMGYDPAAPTEVAVGIGQYRDETGAALGLFHYPNRDFMLSLSVSTSGDEVMGGIGATWKFGRKSPEKVLAAEKEKAAKAKLAKAEAMKKAAKEAKIKAQQERHAKLAAERAAQAEAAK